MSYRNPQIIVDRSAEIWAQGVAKLGQAIGQGITNYFEAKKLAEQKVNKVKEANNRLLVDTELKHDKLIVEGASDIKDYRVRKQFQDIFRAKGDLALKSNVELTLNTDLDSKARNEYRKNIFNFETYMVNSKDQANNIHVGAEEVKNITIDNLVNGYAATNGDDLSSYLAAKAVNEEKVPGVESVITISATDDNSNIFDVKSKIKKGSNVYNKYKEAGIFENKELYKESDDYITVNFKRNMSDWDGSFFEKIAVTNDRNKALKEADVINGKNSAINKNFVLNNMTTRTVRSEADGSGYRYKEEVINENALRNNISYQNIIKSEVSGLMSYPMKQQKDFITGALNWGSDVAKVYEEKDHDLRYNFLYQEFVKRDLAIMGKPRMVTDEDVENIPGLSKYNIVDSGRYGKVKLPNYIYVKQLSKPTRIDPEDEDDKKLTIKQQSAKRAVKELLADPLSYLTSVAGTEKSGIKSRDYDPATKIFQFARTNKKTGTVSQKKYNLNNKDEFKQLARELYKFKAGVNQEVFELIDQEVDSYFGLPRF